MSNQPADCPHPRACPMDSRAFIERMAAIEAEIRDNRENRHARNSAVNAIVNEIRVDQNDLEERFDEMHQTANARITMLENLMARITQLLDGYQGQGGLVARVGELAESVAAMPHGTILERMNAIATRTKALEARQTVTDRKLYIATGIIICLQVLAGLGAFPNLFAR
jgi:uncharacterized protein (DUF342 family)